MTFDRRRLVRRNNPVLTAAHPTDVLSVGNGDIALTVDLSGLQTFRAFHELVPDPQRVVTNGLHGLPVQRPRAFNPDDFQIPLRTQSTWGWYTTRTTRPLDRAETVTHYDSPRGKVPYLDRMGLQRAGDPIPDALAAGAWFHFNPRRLHLGRLALTPPDGAQPLSNPEELRDTRTELDLWTGAAHAQYRLRGESVSVTTVADPFIHRFATRIDSALVRDGWGVSWIFDGQPDDLASFELPLEESTAWTEAGPERWAALRTVESTTYSVEVVTTGRLLMGQNSDAVTARSDTGVIEVVVTLRPHTVDDEVALPSFAATRDAAEEWWRSYWADGAAVSFEGSTEVQAAELERRVVLSQYLTAVNGSGATPPAETGLTYNTWTGKFHLEMHWWHAAHFAMWGRGHLLERSLPWYHAALPAARSTAEWQGYRGARWPKQTDPSAQESPSNIGVFLIWQQPHIIYLLELLRAEGRGEGFLLEHYPLVEETADFMADFAAQTDGAFTLPPPLVPAQESYLADRRTNADPTFELAYWSWALRVANEWREQLDLPRRQDWHDVAVGMSAPVVLADGTYAALATPPQLIREDHPSMLMALGWLPETELIDRRVMSDTLDSVWRQWDLQTSWGWDYPVLAMTAARLDDIERAFQALVMPSPKNVFLRNGHNPQIPGFLSLYLPANGGLLAAIAHIAQAIDRGAALPPGWRMQAEGFETLNGMSSPVGPERGRSADRQPVTRE